MLRVQLNTRAPRQQQQQQPQRPQQPPQQQQQQQWPTTNFTHQLLTAAAPPVASSADAHAHAHAHCTDGRKVSSSGGARGARKVRSRAPSGSASFGSSASTPHAHPHAATKAVGAGATAAGAAAPTHPTASSGGRKVFKQEVTQLQNLVDGMQQQVQAATREIQELRSMVGRIADSSALQQQHPQHQPQQPHTPQQQFFSRQQPRVTPLLATPQYEELQALTHLHAPLLTAYQQPSAGAFIGSRRGFVPASGAVALANGTDDAALSYPPVGLSDDQRSEIADHFAFLGGGGGGGADAQLVADSLGFDCRMEQAMLCDDDDDYPLYFES